MATKLLPIQQTCTTFEPIPISYYKYSVNLYNSYSYFHNVNKLTKLFIKKTRV